MKKKTSPVFEQLLNAKESDEILASVTRCIWEADKRQGDPPIPSLKQIQDTTAVVEKYKDVHIVPDNIATFQLNIKEEGRIEATGDNVSHKKIGNIYLYKVEGIHLEDMGFESMEALQEAMDTPTVISAYSSAISAYFMKTAGEPDAKKVEWAHQMWKERRENNEHLEHPLTQVVRAWIRRNPPLCKIEQRDKQIAPAFIKESHNITDTSERFPTGTLHSQGTEVQGQLPLFQESEDDIIVQALPIEIYKGAAGGRGAPLDERIFFNAVLACPYGTPEPFNAVRLEPTLRDYVNWLYPNGWHRTNQLPLLQKALYEVHNKRIEYERRAWNIVQVLAMPTENTKMDDVLPLIIRYPDGVGDNGPMIDVHKMRLYGLVSASKWRAWIRLHYLWDTAKQRNGGYPIYAKIPRVKRNAEGYLLDARGEVICSGDPYKTKKGRWGVRRGNTPQKVWYHPAAIHIGSQRNPQCDKIPVLTDKNLVALFFDSYKVEKNTFLKRVFDAKNAAMDMEADGVLIIERDAIDTKRGIKGWRMISVYQGDRPLAKA